MTTATAPPRHTTTPKSRRATRVIVCILDLGALAWRAVLATITGIALLWLGVLIRGAIYADGHETLADAFLIAWVLVVGGGSLFVWCRHEIRRAALRGQHAAPRR